MKTDQFITLVLILLFISGCVLPRIDSNGNLIQPPINCDECQQFCFDNRQLECTELHCFTNQLITGKIQVEGNSELDEWVYYCR